MSLPYSKVAVAQVALREAAHSLDIGVRVLPADAGLDSLALRAVAADLAYAMDALAEIVRHVSFGPVPTSAPPSGVSCHMQTLFHHVRDGATMARHIAAVEGAVDGAVDGAVAGALLTPGVPMTGPDD
ncbi:hypothetical protein [Actinomycetospora flava]|uniref:PE family protein n=1 Tax=Actinomycetospora flava TaxID=3129232 RepID=A0ABU8MCG6_9PSEU